MITEPDVYKHLMDTGKINDRFLVEMIEDSLSRDRHLDKPPAKLRLVSVKQKQICGLAAEFESIFNAIYASGNDDAATIKMAGQERLCDYKVYVTLKSLVLTGTHRDEKRASACRELFMQIIQLPGTYITASNMFVQILQPNGEYYHDTICSAITKVAFTSKEILLYSVMQVSYGKPDYAEFSKKVISHFFLQSAEELPGLYERFYKKCKKRGLTKAQKAIEYLYSTPEEEW